MMSSSPTPQIILAFVFVCVDLLTQDLVEMTRVTLVGATSEAKLLGALETLIETTQDFTDSAYTSHDNRERILLLCERLRQELATLLRVGRNVVGTRI